MYSNFRFFLKFDLHLFTSWQWVSPDWYIVHVHVHVKIESGSIQWQVVREIINDIATRI